MAFGSEHSPSNLRKRWRGTRTSSAASCSKSQSPTSTLNGTFAAARSDTSGPIPEGQPTETTSMSVLSLGEERTIAVRVTERLHVRKAGPAERGDLLILRQIAQLHGQCRAAESQLGAKRAMTTISPIN